MMTQELKSRYWTAKTNLVPNLTSHVLKCRVNMQFICFAMFRVISALKVLCFSSATHYVIDRAKQ